MEMMRHFAMYWRPSTVEAARAHDDLLLYAASSQFDRVSQGDTIWLLTAPAGRLTLVGKIEVDVLLGRDAAVARLGTEVWPSELYALPPPNQPRDRIRSLDLTVDAPELRFITAEGEAKLEIGDGGIVNPQQLQTMRVLTDASATRLEHVWRGRERALVRVADAATIRANINEFNATAAVHRDRASSLLALTEYWVFDEVSDRFGPAKFVGYEAATFDQYEAAQRNELVGAPFDGHVTRKAIEAVLGDFVEDVALSAQLDGWALQLLGDPVPEVDRAKWRFARLGSRDARASTRNSPKPRKDEQANDLMYDCDAKLLFVEKGSKIWRWETRGVKAIGDDRDVRCTHCHGAVRIHRQKVPHGAADHVEHLRRRDSEHCRGGHHFQGDHRLSDEPLI